MKFDYVLTGLQISGYEVVEDALGPSAVQGSRAPVPDGAGGTEWEPTRDQSRAHLQVYSVTL